MIVTPPVVPVTVPLLFTRFPFRVKRLLPRVSVAPLFTVNGAVFVVKAPPKVNLAELFSVSGTLALSVLAASVVIVPVLSITTPPVAANVLSHSSVVDVLLVAVL